MMMHLQVGCLFKMILIVGDVYIPSWAPWLLAITWSLWPLWTSSISQLSLTLDPRLPQSLASRGRSLWMTPEPRRGLYVLHQLQTLEDGQCRGSVL